MAQECRVLAVNDAYRLVPGADVTYAADGEWWDVHHAHVRTREMWTQDVLAARRHGLSLVLSARDRGMAMTGEMIHRGGNSGFQALNLAVLWGATRIVLFGFDMRGDHFFGRHPAPLRNTHDYQPFIEAFNEAAPQLRDAGIDVVNASPVSALRCFRRVWV